MGRCARYDQQFCNRPTKSDTARRAVRYKTEHLHRILDGIVIAHHNPVVIDARRTFRCAHTYVALKVTGVQVFVCASCEYRTELLPLAKEGSPSGRGALVSINRVRRRSVAARPSLSIGRI